MKIPLAAILITLGLISPALAVLEHIPAVGITLEGRIKEIKISEREFRDFVTPEKEFYTVTIENVDNLSKEEAKDLKKILRSAGFKLENPNKGEAFLVFTKKGIGILKVGDVVTISNYQVVVGTETPVGSRRRLADTIQILKK